MGNVEESGSLSGDDWLTVGQMAELCSVSRKALRLYHERGILSPAMLDRDTGYRYYVLDQVPIVDRISRLQNIGFSLNDIKTILEGCDGRKMALLYETQLERTREELVRLSAARDMLEGFLVDQCSEGAHITNRALLEWVPERKAMFFDLGDLSFSLSRAYNQESVKKWYYVLSSVRRELYARGVPAIACSEVSTVIPRECLETQDLTVTRACILVNDALVSYLRDYEVIPAGYFLTYYSESFYDEEGEYVERKAIANMLEVAREKGYGLRGDYIGIGNIDEPLALQERRGDRLRYQIPVSVTG